MGLPDASNLKAVGRLDIRSEGLLLLTDDGELARFLEHPEAGLRREYHVRVFGGVQANMVKQMRRGLVIDSGTKLQPMEVQVMPVGNRRKQGLGEDWTLQERPEKGDWGRNTWLRMALVEGKNREIRRTMEHFGLTVSRLRRVRYGPYSVEGIDKGAALQVPVRKELLGKAKDWI